MDVNKILADAEKFSLPNECEENDRAVRYLALNMGVGHYDNLNLLILSALVIFISVCFLSINGGDIDDNDNVQLSKKSFLSGEYTEALEKNYNEQLPIPELMKSAEERISLIYGIGNKLSESGKRSEETPDPESNPFEPNDYNYNSNDDRDKHKENVITTKAVETDENGNVTSAENAETAPGGGSTAVSRPSSTVSTFTFSTAAEEETTTNNDPPVVTTTTTVRATTVTTTSTTTTTTTPEPDSSVPDDSSNNTDASSDPVTEPPVSEEPDVSEPSETELSETEPSETEAPTESDAPVESSDIVGDEPEETTE